MIRGRKDKADRQTATERSKPKHQECAEITRRNHVIEPPRRLRATRFSAKWASVRERKDRHLNKLKQFGLWILDRLKTPAIECRTSKPSYLRLRIVRLIRAPAMDIVCAPCSSDDAGFGGHAGRARPDTMTPKRPTSRIGHRIVSFPRDHLLKTTKNPNRNTAITKAAHNRPPVAALKPPNRPPSQM